MATGAASGVFLDTNVLVYSAVAASPFNLAARNAIANHEAAGTQLWISRQVVREYLAVLSRPQAMSAPQPLPILISDVQHFQSRFLVAEDGPNVTAELLRIIAPISIGGKRIHDANIVATMLAHGISMLLTNNPHDFGGFSNLIDIEPL